MFETCSHVSDTKLSEFYFYGMDTDPSPFYDQCHQNVHVYHNYILTQQRLLIFSGLLVDRKQFCVLSYSSETLYFVVGLPSQLVFPVIIYMVGLN